MKAKSVPSSWLQRDGRRLDCGPYMSGALEAKVLLEGLQAKKVPLQAVCLNGRSGLVNAGRIKRLWVTDEQHGLRFLSSTDILKSDLSDLQLISKRAARANPKLLIKSGWTLITRAGTIGRMAFARPDMDGLACSEDVLRVVPDPEKIPPGYLYAYLSSKFGVPLVVGGTYGAIIQHIEPEHIADLPVPRLGKEVEQRAHELVTRAANARTEASRLLAASDDLFVDLLSLPKPKLRTAYSSPYIASASSSEFIRRGDGYYYAPLNTDARRAFDSAQATATLGDVAEVFIPGIFKRQYASDPAFGVPYITGADVFQLAPTTDQYLLKRIASDVGLVLQKGMIVIQEAGQLGGLIGRSVLVGDHLDGFACSNNMVRVTAKNEKDTGYLFAVLASTYGVRLISREAAGSSIPHLEVGRVRALSIPWPEEKVRARVGRLVMDAQRLRDEAVSADREARALVEAAIEKGATN
ncbi:MAG: restriction endonuclease subunit S [Sandaracinaceae bacterium]